MWFFSFRKARRTAPARHRSAAYRPRLEALEDRCLLSAGALDPTFNPAGNPPGTATVAINANAYPRAVLAQPSGKIILAGYSTNSTTQNGMIVTGSYFSLAEFDPNGSLDPNFGSGGTVTTSANGTISPQTAHAAVLYPTGSTGDEKIVVAGYGTTSTKSGFVLVRYNADGSLDTSFGSGGMVLTSFKYWTQGNGAVGIVLQPNGTSPPKIIAVGSTGGPSGSTINPDGSVTFTYSKNTGIELARYNPDGSLDTTFGSHGTVYTPIATGGFVEALSLALDPVNGDLIVGGQNVKGQNGPDYGLLAAYKSNGTLDTSFGTGGLVTNLSAPVAFGVAVYPATDTTGNAGKIVAVGSGPVARYNLNGTPDTTWGGTGEVSTVAQFRAVAIQPDDKVLAGGFDGQFVLARYNPDGSPDGGFGTGGVVTTAIGGSTASAVQAITLQANGDILVAGGAATGSGSTQTVRFAAARYLPSAPQIGSLTANPNPVTAGSSLTLTASNITNGNLNSTVTQVAFYYYDGGGNKVTLGSGTQSSPGVWTFTFTVNLAPGSYTLYAQAEDSYGVFGDPFALPLTVGQSSRLGA